MLAELQKGLKCNLQATRTDHCCRMLAGAWSIRPGTRGWQPETKEKRGVRATSPSPLALASETDSQLVCVGRRQELLPFSFTVITNCGPQTGGDREAMSTRPPQAPEEQSLRGGGWGNTFENRHSLPEKTPAVREEQEPRTCYQSTLRPWVSNTFSLPPLPHLSNGNNKSCSAVRMR